MKSTALFFLCGLAFVAVLSSNAYAWDATTIYYTGSFGNVTTVNQQPEAIRFSTDGRYLYTVDSSNGTISQFFLSTPFNVSTRVYQYHFVPGGAGAQSGIWFNETGTGMYITDRTAGNVEEFRLSTAWNLSTHSGIRNSTLPAGSNFNSFILSSSGAKGFYIAINEDVVVEVNLTRAFDTSTMVYNRNLSIASMETDARGIDISNDGNYLFIIGQTNQSIVQVNLTAPYSLSGAVYSGLRKQFTGITPAIVTPQTLALAANDTYVYVASSVGDGVWWFNTNQSFNRNYLSITARNNYTAVSLTTFNATINGTFYSTTNGTINTLLNITPGHRVNITVSAPNYFTTTLHNWNISTNPVANLTPHTEIRAFSALTGTAINNFTVRYANNANTSDSGSTSTTNGLAYVPVVSGTFTVNITDAHNLSTQYADGTANLTGNPYLIGYNFSLYTSQSITFRFYDEENNTLLNTTTVTVYLTSATYSTNFTTSNGTKYIDLLTPAAYTITYSAPGYAQREYLYTVTDRSTTQIDLYLLSDSEDTLVLSNVLDTLSRKVANATVKMQKKNLTGTNYYIVEMCNTDILGKCLLHAQLYDTTYRFIVDYNGETKLNSGDTRVTSTEFTFIINVDANLLSKYYETNSITGSLSHTNNTFTFTWNDVYGNTQNACLRVERRVGARLTTINSSCTAASTGTITLPYTSALGDEWIATAYVIVDGDTLILDTDSVVTDDFKGQFGANGLYLFGFLLLGVMMFSALYHPIAALVMGGIGLFVLNGLGFISVGTTAVVSLACALLIVIIMLKRT